MLAWMNIGCWYLAALRLRGDPQIVQPKQVLPIIISVSRCLNELISAVEFVLAVKWRVIVSCDARLNVLHHAPRHQEPLLTHSSVCLTSFLSQACFLWQLRNVPAPSESFDQQHAGIHAAAKNVDVIAFVRQRNRLGVNYLEICVYATLVPVRK
jgi:hypothetical protein